MGGSTRSARAACAMLSNRGPTSPQGSSQEDLQLGSNNGVTRSNNQAGDPDEGAQLLEGPEAGPEPDKAPQNEVAVEDSNARAASAAVETPPPQTTAVEQHHRSDAVKYWMLPVIILLLFILVVLVFALVVKMWSLPVQDASNKAHIAKQPVTLAASTLRLDTGAAALTTAASAAKPSEAGADFSMVRFVLNTSGLADCQHGSLSWQQLQQTCQESSSWIRVTLRSRQSQQLAPLRRLSRSASSAKSGSTDRFYRLTDAGIAVGLKWRYYVGAQITACRVDTSNVTIEDEDRIATTADRAITISLQVNGETEVSREHACSSVEKFSATISAWLELNPRDEISVRLQSKDGAILALNIIAAHTKTFLQLVKT